MYFWLRQELKEWQSLSVPSLTFCLEHSILHITLSGLSHGLPQVSGFSSLGLLRLTDGA